MVFCTGTNCKSSLLQTWWESGGRLLCYCHMCAQKGTLQIGSAAKSGRTHFFCPLLHHGYSFSYCNQILPRFLYFAFLLFVSFNVLGTFDTELNFYIWVWTLHIIFWISVGQHFPNIFEGAFAAINQFKFFLDLLKEKMIRFRSIQFQQY